MNAIDLYKVWETFNRMIEDPAFDVQAKQAMGGEMILSLPPEMLCAVSKSSLNAVKAAMKSRLTNLVSDNNAEREQPTEGHSTPKVESKVRRPRRSSNT